MQMCMVLTQTTETPVCSMNTFRLLFLQTSIIQSKTPNTTKQESTAMKSLGREDLANLWSEIFSKLPKLASKQANMLGNPLTLDGRHKALEKMPYNKSPEPDGFPQK